MSESPIYSTTSSLASDSCISAGVILCGGKSLRMGTPKAWLDFAGQPLLLRVIERIRPAVNSIVVVAAHGQSIPPLPGDAQLIEDEYPDEGPLSGMLTALRALPATLQSIYLSACDAPFLRPQFIQRLAALRGQADLAIPEINGHLYPLSAVYATTITPIISRLFDGGERRMRAVADHVNTIRCGANDLIEVDPELESLMNVNTPAELELARARIADTRVDSIPPK